jgi:hypothetical protein
VTVSPWLITTMTLPTVASTIAKALVGHPVTAATGAVVGVLVLGAAIALVGHAWGRRSRRSAS